jgi:hypothetical protein
MRSVPKHQGSILTFAAIFTALWFSASASLAQAPGSSEPTPRSTLPAALEGDWVNATSSSVSYEDGVTGSLLSGGGAATVYHFWQDGRYTESVIVTSRLYECELRQQSFSQGTVTLQNGILTLYPQAGRHQTSDSCGRYPNEDKVRKRESERFLVALGPDPNDPTGTVRLWLKTASGLSTFTRP